VRQKLLEAWALKSVPVVTIADGIIMGAGAGLWMASSLRYTSLHDAFVLFFKIWNDSRREVYTSTLAST